MGGDIFVFTSPDDPSIDHVEFWIDDPETLGAPDQIENNANSPSTATIMIMTKAELVMARRRSILLHKPIRGHWEAVFIGACLVQEP